MSYVNGLQEERRRETETFARKSNQDETATESGLQKYSSSFLLLLFCYFANLFHSTKGYYWLGGKLPLPSAMSLVTFTVTCHKVSLNWRAPWKNRLSSTSMKLRKSLVKPVTWQNISSCSVLSPEIVVHDAFNVILWTSADICVVVHDDLGWKNRTSRYILPRHWLYEWFSSAANVRRYMCRAWRSRVKELNNTL